MDYHSTTPVDPRVAAAVVEAMTVAYGNPRSSDHGFGDHARELIEMARAEVGLLVNCEPAHITFLGSATEALQVGMRRALARARRQPAHVLALPVEHRAVLRAIELAVDAKLAQVSWLSVDTLGRLDLPALDDLCAGGGFDVVCAMAANNEIGNIYPVQLLAQRARALGAMLLVDGTQAVGHVRIDVRGQGLDLLALSGHKMYGPKGIGALVDVHQAGPNQEAGAGTPNVPGIAGLGEACRLRRLEMAADEQRVADLRDRLERTLAATIPGLVVNGDRNGRLAGNLHVSVRGVPNDAVVARLRETLAISTGAACSAGALTPSHVLQALSLPEEIQEGALRIGLGKFTSAEDVADAGKLLAQAVRDVRASMGVPAD